MSGDFDFDFGLPADRDPAGGGDGVDAEIGFLLPATGFFRLEGVDRKRAGGGGPFVGEIQGVGAIAEEEHALDGQAGEALLEFGQGLAEGGCGALGLQIFGGAEGHSFAERGVEGVNIDVAFGGEFLRPTQPESGAGGVPAARGGLRGFQGHASGGIDQNEEAGLEELGDGGLFPRHEEAPTEAEEGKDMEEKKHDAERSRGKKPVG